MKVEQLLVQHLYDCKEVTLQGIGTLTLSGDIIFPDDKEKDIVIPSAAISFTYNPKAKEDDALINFIVQQTRKIKPLASADFDSYVVLGKQFLNIGKPFRIEGIGTLIKNQQGEYEFTPGNFITPKIEATPSLLKEKNKADEIFFGKEENKGTRKKWLLAIGGILLLGALGFSAWYLLTKKQNDKEDIKRSENPTVTSNDTLSKKTDTTGTTKPVAITNNGYTFKIMFDQTVNRAAAEKRMAALIARGHKVIMYTADSITYKLAEPFALPLSDTAYIKDSLNRFYYLGKAKVEL